MPPKGKGTVTDVLAKADSLPKWNAERDIRSRLQSDDLPIMDKGQVQFKTGESCSLQPASCYNCVFMNRDNTCAIMSPEIRVEKFVWPEQPKTGEIQIEYWPWCGRHTWGRPPQSDPYHCADEDPNDLGLTWINAPSLGLKYGGANCGGTNGGDNCDNYQSDEKPDQSHVGFCRVLQQNVRPDDRCAAWQDDDEVTWQRAQEVLKGLGEDHSKKVMVRDMMKRD